MSRAADEYIEDLQNQLADAEQRIAELEADQPLALSVEGAHKLLDERSQMRAALERLHRLTMNCDKAGVFKGAWTLYVEEACAEASKALALGTGLKAPLNPASSASGGKASEVSDLLLDLLDYFEPRMEADDMTPNTEMKFWTRIKEVRGER